MPRKVAVEHGGPRTVFVKVRGRVLTPFASEAEGVWRQSAANPQERASSSSWGCAGPDVRAPVAPWPR